MKLQSHLFLLFFLFVKIAFAQFNTETAPKNKWGITLAVNSIQAQIAIPLMTGSGVQIIDSDGNILTGGNRSDKSYSFSIVPKYDINNDILMRFEFGLTNLSLKANSDEKGSVEHVIYNRIVTNKIYHYALGFQWIFMKTKKMESYCGLTVSYLNYKPMNHHYYNAHRESTTDTLLYWTKGTEITPGGFVIGAGAFTGFNIYLSKRISLGAELSSSALYYKLGGTTTSEEIQQNLPYNINTYTTTYINSYKGFKISKIRSSFNISLWF